MPVLKADSRTRCQEASRLAPFIEAALQRKKRMQPLGQRPDPGGGGLRQDRRRDEAGNGQADLPNWRCGFEVPVQDPAAKTLDSTAE